jgi:hypothetical protein
MKTYKRLYPRIYDFENLYLAFRKARKGKRSRPDVAAFEFNLEFELPQLQEELETELCPVHSAGAPGCFAKPAEGSYHPGPYRHFTLYERKPRRISAAPFRDRVVHHALCNVVEPIRSGPGLVARNHPEPVEGPTLRAGR